MKITHNLTLIGLVAAGLFLPSAASAFTQNFENSVLSKDKKQGGYFIKDAKKDLSGSIYVVPNKDFSDCKISLKENILTIDTQKIYKTQMPGHSTTFRSKPIGLPELYLASAAQTAHEKTNRMSIEINSSKPAEIALYFEGVQNVDGKHTHYWCVKNVDLNEGWQTVSFDQVLPDNLQKVWVRITIRQPLKISIRKLTVEQIAAEK
jgi:hypothetical protein